MCCARKYFAISNSPVPYVVTVTGEIFIRGLLGVTEFPPMIVINRKCMGFISK